MRGADIDRKMDTGRFHGAPPRAWGGRLGGGAAVEDGRSTPTCVGRTRRAVPARASDTEHPHVLGADYGVPAGHRPWGGSTPTCVGRTRRLAARSSWTWEHPHVRGADGRVADLVADRGGAPPRAWGGRAQHPGRRIQQRSTPTCVGRTVEYGQSWPPSHGAPPRAWGGQHVAEVGGQPVRSTPTCVGRTTPQQVKRCGATEHPHVRGADAPVGTGSAEETLAGAPPRAWGGRQHDLLGTRHPRSTPTCVGRTPSA